MLCNDDATAAMTRNVLRTALAGMSTLWMIELLAG